MTTVNTVATADARRSRGGIALPALLGVTCLLAGLSLMVTLASGLRDLGANSGQMQHLLALNAPASGELVETLGPAGPGVDNMAFYAALCAAGLAAATGVGALRAPSGDARAGDWRAPPPPRAPPPRAPPPRAPHGSDDDVGSSIEASS